MDTKPSFFHEGYLTPKKSKGFRHCDNVQQSYLFNHDMARRVSRCRSSWGRIRDSPYTSKKNYCLKVDNVLL